MSAYKKWMKGLALVLVISLMIGILWTPALADEVSSGTGSDEIGDGETVVTGSDVIPSDNGSEEPNGGEPTEPPENDGTQPGDLPTSFDPEPESDPETEGDTSVPTENPEPDEVSQPSQEVEVEETPEPTPVPTPTPTPTLAPTPTPTPEIPNYYGDPGFGDEPGIDEPTITASGVATVDGQSYETLQEAIKAAGPGAVINLLQDVNENIEFENKEGVITLNLGDYTIRGSASLKPVVGVHNSSVIINGGIITGGAPKSKNGGRGIVSINGNLTLNNVIISENKGAQHSIVKTERIYDVYGYGAGIFAMDGTIIMNGCTVQNNTNTSTANNLDGGGMYVNNCSVTMTDCVISDNISGKSGSGGGGGIFATNSTVTVENCTFSGNKGKQGAAVSLSQTEFTSKNTDYEKNAAGGAGTAIYENSGNARGDGLKNITIIGGTFYGNVGVGTLPRLLSLAGNVTIKDVTFSEKMSGSQIYFSNTYEAVSFNISGVTVQDCDGTGPLIYFSGKNATVVIEDCTLQNNTPISGGDTAAVLVLNDGTGTTTIRNCNFLNNTFDNTTKAKGTIYVSSKSQATAIIENCTVEGTTGANAAIATSGPATIKGGKVQNNTGNYAGGIYAAGNTTVDGTIVSGNTCTGSYSKAGGIYQSSYLYTLTLKDVQVINNRNEYTSGTIAGGVTSAGSFVMTGSLIQGNYCANTTRYAAGGIACSETNATLLIEDSVIKENTGSVGGIFLGSSKSFAMNSGAIYNNKDLTGNYADFYHSYNYSKTDKITFPKASEMVDNGEPLAGYVWYMNGKKADVPNDTGVWSVQEDENASAVEIVREDGSIGYDDLIEAIAAANAGDTIRLLKPVVQVSKTYKLSKTITIDLNGKNLVFSGGNSYPMFEVLDNCTLTIKGTGVVGQFIEVGDRAGTRDKYKGHLIIDVDGEMAFSTLRDGADYVPLQCVNGSITVKGNGNIEKLASKADWNGTIAFEKSVTFGELDVTGSRTENTDTQVDIHCDALKLALSLYGSSSAILDGTVGQLYLTHNHWPSNGVNYKPTTTAGENLEITEYLEFFPTSIDLKDNKFADPTEESEDIPVIVGLKENQIKFDLSKAAWSNTIGQSGKLVKDLIWKVEDGGNGLNYYDKVQFIVKPEDEAGLYLHKNYAKPRVYLSGSGSDENSGDSRETAVYSFAKALSLANLYKVDVIYVVGTVKVASTETWNGTLDNGDTVKLIRGSVEESDKGNMVLVAKGAELTLNNIVLDGSSEIGQYKTLSVNGSIIEVQGTLNIKAGTTLQNNKKTANGNNFSDVGGAIYANGGTVNMEDGMITNCVASFGGAIGLYHEATLNFKNGTITGNTAAGDYSVGGGICAAYDSVINMEGGVVSNNKAYWGGGIGLGANNSTLVQGGKTTLNLKGGTITENKCSNSGGGIFIQVACTANIEGTKESQVYITNNVQTGNSVFGGGGIYVNGGAAGYAGLPNGVVNIKDVEIAYNTAGGGSGSGGAIAACPTSNTKLYIGGGAVIHDNSGKGTVYILSGILAGGGKSVGVNHNPGAYLSDIMLGGAKYNWENLLEEKYKANEYAQCPAIDMNSWYFVAKPDNAAAVEAGSELATVHINGNIGTAGAGIGSNGDIVIGTAETTAIHVQKKVEGFNASKHLNEVFHFTITFEEYPGTIQLVRNGRNKGIVPFGEGGYTFTFDLTPNEFVMFTGLAVGTKYSITESTTGATQTTVTYAIDNGGDETIVGSTYNGAVLGKNQVTFVEFGNHYDEGALSFGKEVSKNGDPNIVWLFELTLTTHEYKQFTTKIPDDFKLISKTVNGADVTYVLQFVLRGDNVTKTLKGIPDGTNYSVKELGVANKSDDPNYKEGSGFIYADDVVEEGKISEWHFYKEMPTDDYNPQPQPKEGVVQASDPDYRVKAIIFLNVKEVRAFTVEKVWDYTNLKEGETPELSLLPDSINVTLTGTAPGKDGKPIKVYEQTLKIEKVIANDTPIYKGTFSDIPKYYDGVQINYNVTEEPVEGWKLQSTGPVYGHIDGGPLEIKGWTLKNVQNVININVVKYWTNADGKDTTENLPEEIKVQLYRNSEKLGESVALNADNEWTYEYKNLPKTDKEGNPYNYSVREEVPDGWHLSATGPVLKGGSMELVGWSLTNKRAEPGKITIPVTKVWHNANGSNATVDLPESIVVELRRNGQSAGQSITLNAGNQWKGEFKDLPVADENGNALTYDVAEVAVTGWTSQNTGTQESGFTITNTRDEPEPTGTPQPTDTPEPTGTPQPTDTPEPTDTPRPTETPRPTNTPQPSSTPEPSVPPTPTPSAPQEQTQPPEEHDNPNEPQNPNEPTPEEDNPNQDIPNRDVPQGDRPDLPEDHPNEPNTPEDEPGTDLPDSDVPTSDFPPSTGETIMTIIWIGLLVVSGAGILITARTKKRE